ncbi:hypothetical protein FOA52_010821 [Chlamydomonas sp. UWO 241]|nr:hypothetical protein FOA52_010821 [Chlamydomonas sp. UWO 241]
MSTVLTPSAESGAFTGTKVIATLGPACHSPEILAQMMEAGMVAARIDLTWGPLEFHRNSLKHLEAAMRSTRRLCATQIDTMGRELMIRGQKWVSDADGYPHVTGSMDIEKGATVTITTREDVEASAELLPINYSDFTKMVQPADKIFIARYLASGAEGSSLYLEVQEVTETDVICVALSEVTLEGLLTIFHVERSGGETVCSVQNALPLLSEWDKVCITALGKEFDIDFINVSYVRTAQDIHDAFAFLSSIGLASTKIVAKIETREALLNFQSILSEADGIVISRGNLGLDVEPEKMALVQKTLIQACNMVGKPVVLTRVVDTMVNTPRPTRAEATDVANAVLDGVDAIMFGSETLRDGFIFWSLLLTFVVGKYPVQAIETIVSICRAAEAVFNHLGHSTLARKYPVQTIETVVSICRAAEAVFDHSGHYTSLMEAAWDAVQQTSRSGKSLSSSDTDLASQMVVNASLQDFPAGGRPQRRGSFSSLVKAMATFSQVASNGDMAGDAQAGAYKNTPYLSKLESIASSAVRAADKVRASLIVVYTHTGQTAELVAKYRPPVPILTLVVPHLVAEGLKWKLEALLADAINSAARQGLVRPGDHVVVVQRVHADFCIKIIAVNAAGTGIAQTGSI